MNRAIKKKYDYQSGVADHQYAAFPDSVDQPTDHRRANYVDQVVDYHQSGNYAKGSAVDFGECVGRECKENLLASALKQTEHIIPSEPGLPNEPRLVHIADIPPQGEQDNCAYGDQYSSQDKPLGI